MTPRKLVALALILIVPGALVAAGSAWLLRVLSRTERGQKAMQVVRERLPDWAAPVRGFLETPPQAAA